MAVKGHVPMCKTCGTRHYNLNACSSIAPENVPFTPTGLSVPAGFKVKKEFGDPQDPNAWGGGLPPGKGWGQSSIPFYRPTARIRTGVLTPPPEMELPS